MPTDTQEGLNALPDTVSVAALLLFLGVTPSRLQQELRECGAQLFVKLSKVHVIWECRPSLAAALTYSDSDPPYAELVHASPQRFSGLVAITDKMVGQALLHGSVLLRDFDQVLPRDATRSKGRIVEKIQPTGADLDEPELVALTDPAVELDDICVFRTCADDIARRMGHQPPSEYPRTSPENYDDDIGKDGTSNLPTQAELRRLFDTNDLAHAPELAFALSAWRELVLPNLTEAGRLSLGKKPLDELLLKKYKDVKFPWRRAVGGRKPPGLSVDSAKRIATVIRPLFLKRAGTADNA